MKYEITEEQIYQIHSVLHDGNTPIFDKQSLEKMFPDVFKEEKKELPKYFTGWIKTKSRLDEKYLGYSENGIIKYGLSSNEDWFEGNDGSISSDDYEATEEEVKESLTKEAVKRGYKIGIFVLRPDSFVNKGEVKIMSSDFELFGTNKRNLQLGGYSIFESGVWAEIIPTITKEQAEKELGKKIID